jgi:oligoribonuclease
VIKPDDSALAHMNDFVTKMHESSGLLDEIPGGVSLAEAEFEALEYIQRFVPEGKAPLAGNTIGTDRMFLAKYMPRVDRWLHYRNVDVSSIKELSVAGTRVPTSTRPRRTAATARSRTSASRSASSAYYREAVFVPAPGLQRRGTRRRSQRRVVVRPGV